MRFRIKLRNYSYFFMITTHPHCTCFELMALDVNHRIAFTIPLSSDEYSSYLLHVARYTERLLPIVLVQTGNILRISVLILSNALLATLDRTMQKAGNGGVSFNWVGPT